ncbi:MAG TPA: translocation/assembly module TamB domain-containing protein [bacterium]|nr:translocation/assembly module TamB domain-containing protein [bacterium]HPN46283.1 translocation/assembly module TamB domain-containing protein [bacterium]
MRKKTIISIFLVLLLLIAGAAIITQTKVFKSWLGARITLALTNTINGQVVINEIDGNLVTNFHISGLQVIAPADTILSISELTIGFKPLDLLHKKLTFNIISITSPVIKLASSSNNNWNYAALLEKQNDDNESQVSARNNNAALNLSCERMLIHNGFIQVATGADSGQIFRIRDINAHAGFTLNNNQLSARLEKLQFRSLNPPINIPLVQFSLELDSLLSVQNVLLQTDSSRITGAGKWNIAENRITQLQIKAEPVNLAEIKQFIPSLPMSGNAGLNIQAHSNNDTLQYRLSVNKGRGEIAGHGSIVNLAAQPIYEININAEKFELAQWLDNILVPISFSGTCRIHGSGTDLSHLRTRVEAQLSKCLINKIPLKSINLSAELANKKIKADLQARHGAGRIGLFAIMHLENRLPYSLTAHVKKLNLEMMAPKLATDINGTIQAQGTLKDSNLPIDITGYLESSSIADFSVDTLGTHFNYYNRQIKIDSLFLHSEPGVLSLNGVVKMDSLSAIRFLYKPGVPGSLWPGHDLHTQGNITGTITGAIDSFLVNTSINLTNLNLDDHSVKKLAGTASVYYLKTGFYGSSVLSLYHNNLAGFKADSIHVESEFHNKNLKNVLSIAVNDTVTGYLNSSVYFNDYQTFTINNLDIKLGAWHWYGEHYPATLKIKKDHYHIDNFNLHSEKQSITIEGTIGRLGGEKLSVAVRNLNLQKMINFIKPGMPVTGVVNIQSQLTGTIDNPDITSAVQCTDLHYQTIKIANTDAEINYNNKTLQFNALMKRNATEEFLVTGSLPVNITAQDNKQIIPQDKPINLSIISQGVDISFLDLFTNNSTRTTGKTSIDVKIAETLAHPLINGTFSVKNASFAIPQYGSYFNNIQMQLEMINNKITIEKFLAQNERGTLQVNGYIGLSNKFDKWEDSNILLKAKNFPIAKSQNLDLTVNSTIQLNGNPETPVFDGSVDILRAKIYIPALLSSKKPLVEQPPSALKQAKDDLQGKHPDQASILDKSRGEIKVNIARNAWLRNDEMNLELTGAMDILKEDRKVQLFGAIQTVRGTIDLYGKQFKIEEGQFTFTGGDELTPELNIKAVHEFRDVYNEKKTLILNIAGKIDRPVINFLLGETQIEDKDAISYLLFGRSSDELSFGEKSQLAQNQGMVSANGVEQMFTSRLSGEISQKLQKRLNLDLIKFKGKSDRGQASLMLGKYITNDLFLSYQRDFNLGGSHEMATDEISLEYEINKFLFLQATKGDDKTTGFDVFWKYEK